VFDQLTLAVLNVFAQAPNAQSQAPPGSAQLTEILGWATWIAMGVCVLGVVIAGGSMAVQHRHGGGGESASRLGWVAAGCVVVGSASAIVNQLV
jgi:hypothetical protein